MSRVLKRPMFKMGGSTSAGITSGLSRRGYHAGERVTGADKLAEWGPAPRSSNVYDFLTEWGLNMASSPPMGNIFSTAAGTAKEPYSRFMKGKSEADKLNYAMKIQASQAAQAENIAANKMAFEESKLAYEKERDVEDRKLQKHLGELEAKGEKEFILERINAYWDPKIAGAHPSQRDDLTKQKESDAYNVIVLGEDISDKYKILTNEAAYSLAVGNAEIEIATLKKSDGTPWTEGDAGYGELLQKIINKYLRLASKFLDPDKKATGGRVGYQNAGPVTPLPNQDSPSLMAKATTDTEVEKAFGVPVSEAAPETKEINISYDQLRDRLPPQISDDIVLLLSQSYEAFADFAEIQTQADVNEFNTKYNVQLFLPQQTGA